MITEETSAGLGPAHRRPALYRDTLVRWWRHCSFCSPEEQQEKPSEQVPNRWELSVLHYS